MNLRAQSNVTRRGMPFAENFFAPDCLGHSAIQTQCRNGSATGWAKTNDASPIPAKMQTPRVAPRVEQLDFIPVFGISRFQSCAFSKRAGNARQRQVVQRRRTARIQRNDVVNVEGRFLGGLGEAAVFATVLRAVNDLTPELRRDGHAVSDDRCSVVANVAGATRADHSNQQGPLLLASRRSLGGRRCPAYRADREAASARPLAVETLPDRPASALSVGWLETYSLSVSGAQSSRADARCPSLDNLNNI